MRPTPKSITSTKLATASNEVVQWDILFHMRLMISHLMDECILWAAGSVIASKEANALIESITRDWLRPYSAPRILIADGETGLSTEHASQWLDRWQIQMKTKAPGEHAQMVERHHELLRRLLLKVEAQLHEEGVRVPSEVIVAECFLAKNVMVTVAGQTPYRALYGRDPPMLSEFELVSETQLDDRSGGLPGHSLAFAHAGPVGCGPEHGAADCSASTRAGDVFQDSPRRRAVAAPARRPGRPLAAPSHQKR